METKINKIMKRIIKLKCFKHLDLDIEQLKQILTERVNTMTHNSAFDMGSRDYEYNRPRKPNIVLDRVINNATFRYENVYKPHLTQEEKDYYYFGYYYRKYCYACYL